MLLNRLHFVYINTAGSIFPLSSLFLQTSFFPSLWDFLVAMPSSSLTKEGRGQIHALEGTNFTVVTQGEVCGLKNGLGGWMPIYFDYECFV